MAGPKEVINQFELTKTLGNVHHTRMGRDITSDYLLCKLEEGEIQAVVELTSTAYYIRVIIGRLTRTLKWEWNRELRQWEQRRLNEEEVQLIEDSAGKTFDVVIRRPNVLTLLRRNVSNNHLAKILANKDETEDPMMEGIKNKVKEVMKSEQEGKK